MSFEAAVHAKAIELDHLCLDMCAQAGSGHPTSAMSIGHLTTVLMYHSMRWSPDQPGHPSSDRLVLSEGHAVPIVYAASADLGVMATFGDDTRPVTREDLSTLREADSPLEGHPNPMEGFAFFDAATGSLGQGLSVAAGLAIAARNDQSDRRIYCLIGDGEAREGQIWEALDFIADFKLANVLPIFNCNGFGQADKTSVQQSPDVLARKLEAYGFVVDVIDGHDPNAIKAAYESFIEGAEGDQPRAVVAKTVKGWGAACLQGGTWHGKPATAEKLEQAHTELNSTGVGLTSSLASDEFQIYPPSPMPAVATAPDAEPMSLRDAMEAWDMGLIYKSGKLATRRAYGLALRALGQTDKRIYSLDADVNNSTFAQWFAKDKDLESRFVECKIAEQNMFSVGAGLSAAGKIPFCSSFGKFIVRGYDQIEMAINSGANLKVVGSHCGVSLAADGPSQMSLVDVAFFRSFGTAENHNGDPACYVLQPADAHAAYALTIAMAEHDGSCYMRTFRPDVEFIYDENTHFELGGMEVLTKGRDLLIVTAGYMVHECNKALDALDKAGIDASLIDLYSLPFHDEETLLDLANENGGNILVVEDNYGASLGSAVTDLCATTGDGFQIEQLHVRRIPKSARNEDSILKYCGLHYTDIAKKAAEMLNVPAGV